MSTPAIGMNPVQKIKQEPELHAYLQQQTIELLACTL